MTTTRKSFGFRVYDADLAQFVRDRAIQMDVETSDVIEDAVRRLRAEGPNVVVVIPDDAPAAVGSTRGSFVVPPLAPTDVDLDRPRRSSFRSRVGAAASASRRAGSINAQIDLMNTATRQEVARADAADMARPVDPSRPIEPVLKYEQRQKGPDSGPDEALGF